MMVDDDDIISRLRYTAVTVKNFSVLTTKKNKAKERKERSSIVIL